MTDPNQGISRRELLRKGAALGGAVAWMTPVVQTVGMGRAFAANGTPEPCSPAISFIIMDVSCNGSNYLIKWEDDGGWESAPGDNNPNCSIGSSGAPANGGTLGFGVVLDAGGCATITAPPGCSINFGAVFGGGWCNPFQGNPGRVCCPAPVG